TPSMSALVIINHVKDGVELAKKFNLNKTIIDFIIQHHGTGLIYYFYQRALEKIKEEEKLKEEAFRYPGPKPQSKETAIVLLADSVEAASRALSDPTPSRIRGLVQKIINNKFIDNQLDECDLTLKDLNKIYAAFVRILTGIFHTRVGYPENDKFRNKIRKKAQ
ncbi:MAG: HD domain-containing protein, partial [Candidatus Omnitrophota bacterium]|nr:HD domain-containing protein [Candidatus Omnitrophota bacterium]